MNANMVNTTADCGVSVSSSHCGPIPTLKVEDDLLPTTADNQTKPNLVQDGGGLLDPTVIRPKKKPPLQRGISRNKSDPKLLPVIIIASIYLFINIVYLIFCVSARGCTGNTEVVIRVK